MATIAKNAKAKKDTSPTDNLKRLTGLIDQLEEHIIRRHKFPYGLPSSYAEHYKAYLPEQTEPVSEEITESDRKWFYEQLDQGLLTESPEQKALREKAWRSSLLKDTTEDIFIPEEDRCPRHYGEIATQIRKFKNVILKIEEPEKPNKDAEKYFKKAFLLYSKHHDSSFYLHTLPEEVLEQVHRSKQSKNKHKDHKNLKRIYLCLVQCLVKGKVLNSKYPNMDFLITDLNQRITPYILEYLIYRYEYEKLVYGRKFDEVIMFLSRLRGPAALGKKRKPIIYSSFAGYPKETLERAREQYREKKRKANLNLEKYLSLYNLYL
ncbi:hypothetical protein [Acinetobacter pittii]|uniref:hypothetical protein n=1 Tax=Acinetobacter pittii TaxID=48296 RepID=UPI00326021E4